MKSGIFIILILAALIFPSIAGARELFDIWEGTSCVGPSGGPEESCSLCDAIIVARNVITDMFVVATMIAVIMIVVGGIILMTSGGSQDKVSSGKKTILNAIIGLGIALAAWAVINTLLGFLTGNVGAPWSEISC